MFWQSYLPQATIFSFGPLVLRWYGLLLVLAIIFAVYYALFKAKNKPAVASEHLDSLFFYLLIFGIIGARLYHVLFFSWGYFSHNLLDIFKIWQGGLAIQGAILASILVIYFWTRQDLSKQARQDLSKQGKKYFLSFWQISDWLAPALALGQFLGRWANYFNQELYGLPSKMWFAIPIEYKNRVEGFEQFSHFQPTFFYESILNLVSFGFLVFLVRKKVKPGLVTLVYLANYSLIRFFLEFVRIDPAPMFLAWRLPQVISLGVFFIVILYILFFSSPALAKDK